MANSQSSSEDQKAKQDEQALRAQLEAEVRAQIEAEQAEAREAEEAKANEFSSETVPGGRYIVGGRTVDANGKRISK